MTRSSVPFLIVVGGPTASGKTGLAIALAQTLAGIILSADSRQIYREFNIGTAKPTRAERQAVPHEFIDICAPTETLTVAEYQAGVQQRIHQLHQGWRQETPQIPLLVGGTGLYIKAVVRGLQIPPVAPQPELRSQLQSLGQPHCYEMLQRVDPAAAQRIHPHDPVRTLRALEVLYVTGKPISQQQGEMPPTYPILSIGLDCAQGEALTQRIAARTAQMLEMGLVAEVEELCDRYGSDLPLLQTLGYREILTYLTGQISLTEAQQQIVNHTRQFAKRQRTWFRHNAHFTWFDAEAPDLLPRVIQHCQQFRDQLMLTTAPEPLSERPGNLATALQLFRR